MRVLLITNAFARVTNGPAKFAHYVLDVAQIMPGHEVRVLSEDVDSPEAAEAIAQGVAYPIQLSIPAWAKPLGQWLRMRPYYERALEIRKEYPWDVLVYINAFQAQYALRQKQVPVLGMINDDNNAQATLAAAFTGMRGLKQWLFRGMEQDAAHKMPLVMTNSRYMTNVLAKAYQLPEERLPVLYKSVDAAPLPYQPERVWPTGDAPWRILFVKTDFVRGGLQDLAEALRVLPQHRFAIEVAGPTYPFHPEITRYFDALPHVTLTILGPQPQAVIRQKLYDAHIFCVPARMEALGVANMEAALAGTPIVSTTAGGIPEVLDEGRAAFLAEPNSPAALANALETCMTNSQERATKQAHARAYVVETFSKERMLHQFIELVNNGVHT